MKFLVQLEGLNKRYIFLDISDPEIEQDIKDMVDRGDCQRARTTALVKGQLIGVFNEREMAHAQAGLIISLNNLHRDLT